MRKLCIAVVLMTFLFGDVFGVNPEIVNEILPEVKPIGQTARLNCTVARLATYTVTWTHIDVNRPISSDTTIETINPKIGNLFKYVVQRKIEEGDRVTFMLIIRRLRQQDAGKYRCTVVVPGVANDRWTSKLALLVVQVAPTIRAGQTTVVRQVERGGNTTLDCGAFGIPTPNITWTRSDGGLLPLMPPVAQYRSSQLPLVNVGERHMGVYRCVADNYIKPPAVHLSEVLVFHPPSTRVVQNSVGQAKGGLYNAKLECIVYGHPQPYVNWYRKEANKAWIQLKDDSKYNIDKQTMDNQNLKSHEHWYTLLIKNIKADEYKYIYYCVAENSFGSHHSVITLFETTECQGSNCPSLPPAAANFLHASLPFLLLVSILTWAFVE